MPEDKNSLAAHRSGARQVSIMHFEYSFLYLLMAIAIYFAICPLVYRIHVFCHSGDELLPTGWPYCIFNYVAENRQARGVLLTWSSLFGVRDDFDFVIHHRIANKNVNLHKTNKGYDFPELDWNFHNISFPEKSEKPWPEYPNWPTSGKATPRP